MKEMCFVFSDRDIAAMTKVKRAFDPDNVMNPGKVLPAPEACAPAQPLKH